MLLPRIENLRSSVAFIFQSKLGLSSVDRYLRRRISTKLYEDPIENCILLEILNWKVFSMFKRWPFFSKIRYF